MPSMSLFRDTDYIPSPSVVGSILSNLRKHPPLQRSPPIWLTQLLVVLVLGMCFFAGGTRFSEQGFGISACPERVCLLSSDQDLRPR
jgi:hypothetical protein